MIEVENGYVSTGFLGDSVNANATPMIFSKFDFHGEKVFQETYGGFNDYQFWAQNPDLQFLNDTTLIHSGVTFDDEGIRLGYLMKSNLEGDTLETIRFYSPNYPDDLEHSSMYPIRLEFAYDGNFLVLSGIVNDETNNDIIIQKFTSEGELLWDYQYATEQDPDVCDVILPTEDGGVIFIMDLVTDDGGFTKLHFNKLDSTGSIDWSFFTSPSDNLGGVKDVLLEGEYLICTTPEVKWENWSTMPGVLKIDTTGNIIWHTPVWQGDYGFNHRGRQLIKAHDGNYITGGIHYEDIPDVPDDSSGFLAKISTEGEVKWQRRFKYFDLFNDEHELYDLRATSDGGYIFCGEAKGTDEDNPEVTGPYQQGWLVKVDEHGCLVEDCHLSDNVSEIDVENKEYFKASPIPASDFLNIYQAQQVSPLALYELYDLQGKLIKSIPIADKHTTLMVDVTNLISGSYILTLREGHSTLQSLQISIR